MLPKSVSLLLLTIYTYTKKKNGSVLFVRVLCASPVRVGVCGVCVCSGDLEFKKKKHLQTHTHTAMQFSLLQEPFDLHLAAMARWRGASSACSASGSHAGLLAWASSTKTKGMYSNLSTAGFAILYSILHGPWEGQDQPPAHNRGAGIMTNTWDGVTPPLDQHSIP